MQASNISRLQLPTVMKITPGTFSIISLGCAKNTVDARSMSALLTQTGLRECSESNQAEIIIVNTCGFILPARQESLETLKSLAEVKPENQILIAAGCLSEREKGDLLLQIPGLDAAIGTRRWMDIARVIARIRDNKGQPYAHFPIADGIGADPQGISRVAIQGVSAYLKIADGCDRTCAFCAIPQIKGRMISRPMEAILADAHALSEAGVQEVNLIAQDTTSWGRDLGIVDGLPVLLRQLIEIKPEISWIRVLYAFPGAISSALIDLLQFQPRILPYLDLPLQHAHPSILSAMRRPSDIDDVKSLITQLRTRIPQLAIRSTFIVGFPGEGQDEFETLLSFIKSTRFDRVGIFPYYHEPGTSAFKLEETVMQAEKEERVEILAAHQESISFELNCSWIGKEMDVLVEGYGSGMSVARSFRDAPEIDGLVFIQSKLPIGKISRVRITDAMTHDLAAEVIKKD